jgi:hypothetical protein
MTEIKIQPNLGKGVIELPAHPHQAFIAGYASKKVEQYNLLGRLENGTYMVTSGAMRYALLPTQIDGIEKSQRIFKRYVAKGKWEKFIRFFAPKVAETQETIVFWQISLSAGNGPWRISSLADPNHLMKNATAMEKYNAEPVPAASIAPSLALIALTLNGQEFGFSAGYKQREEQPGTLMSAYLLGQEVAQKELQAVEI